MDHFIDGRDMQPPEPFERAMEALDGLGKDDRIVLLLHCQPHPLFQVLRRYGYVWDENEGPDGSFEYHIRRGG